MSIKEKLLLQVFAEGAGNAGGAEASGETVESPADDGQAALEALGVPKEKISKRAKEAVSRQRQMAKAQKTVPGHQVAADEKQDEQPAAPAQPEEEKPARMTWQEIMADPEYNREMQTLIRARVKDQDTLRPALEMLASRYQIDVSDPKKLDTAALAKAIMEDDSLWEEKAGELGVDARTARRLEKLERMEAQQEAQAQQTAEEEAFNRHMQQLNAQAEELKKTVPQFDLRREMISNNQFARMISPGGGFDVATAYKMIHHDEIVEAVRREAEEKAAERVAASVQANRNRPVEHGTSGQAPTSTAIDYRSMSREERNRMNAMIKSGKKIYPGQNPW